MAQMPLTNALFVFYIIYNLYIVLINNNKFIFIFKILNH